MKINFRKIFSSIGIILVVAIINIFAQVATGGSYTLNQSAIANGGGTSSNNNYSVKGTSGQTAAGTTALGGNYSTRNGFWTILAAPTAANASIKGRVINENGRGIKNIIMILAGGNLTTPLVTRTNSFGYFEFEEAEVGQTYVISVTSKKYRFIQNSQIISLQEDLTDIVFQGSWIN